MHRNEQCGVGFFLTHGDAIAADVLPAHPQDIAFALRSVETQGQRKPRLAADGMTLLESRDLALAPAMMAFALAAIFLNACAGLLASMPWSTA